MQNPKDNKSPLKKKRKEPEETADILEALKASLQVKGQAI